MYSSFHSAESPSSDPMFYPCFFECLRKLQATSYKSYALCPLSATTKNLRPCNEAVSPVIYNLFLLTIIAIHLGLIAVLRYLAIAHPTIFVGGSCCLTFDVHVGVSAVYLREKVGDLS
ncbi:hypothetical protein F5050DRAFT_469149 [Lentinula boryana]|uniref:Uncharacterized protein n=1 Tax=Lentinula boryana TaxID=40481 RepID=A0ABQ8Q7J6_9AGAR|nr:hypothetical protein F5050DRAFT_469149 [Lentinula boryana]